MEKPYDIIFSNLVIGFHLRSELCVVCRLSPTKIFNTRARNRNSLFVFEMNIWPLFRLLYLSCKGPKYCMALPVFNCESSSSTIYNVCLSVCLFVCLFVCLSQKLKFIFTGFSQSEDILRLN